ncbi:MAG: PilZ domain-containing protein [Syntrophobacteraceae bacterium]
MEKRKHKRVIFKSEAVVRSKEATVLGTIDNLSMKGMFLSTGEKLAGRDILEIEILLTGSSSKLEIRIKGRKVRQTEKGVAIEFSEMDLDSFTHLRNLVAYNSDDADAISDEYYSSITVDNHGRLN